VYLDHDPDEGSLPRFYSQEYFESGADDRGYENYGGCERFLTMNFTRRIERLTRYVPGGPVLDVGCGYGYFLKCLGSQYKGVGIDISEHATRIAIEKYGLDAKTGVLTPSSFPPEHFSLVTMWDVIEHLPDPKRTLSAARDVLKPDGVLALTTGNVGSMTARLCRSKWHLYTLPDHLWFFSEKTIRSLLEETGFRVIELRTEWCYYSIDYLIERLFKTVFNNRDLARRAGAESIFGRWTIPFNLFDVMYVVCGKR
jgi:2-polyprenyl-3-methyl-5-hydroxy-6-metoxy-1,4-benzoquinol methylase